MMPPGHLAATWGVAVLLQRNNPRLARLDYRLLAVSAMLPDFIDKPLAIFIFTDSHSSQNIAHSFLLHVLVLTLTLLWWRQALPYTLAFNAHLLADHMWNHTETFWWPLFGWTVFWGYRPMNTPEDMLNVYLDIIIRYPHVWVIEVMAMAVLVWFVRRYQLYRWPMLKQFMCTGQLLPAKSSFYLTNQRTPWGNNRQTSSLE
jgi:hypothetical protein